MSEQRAAPRTHVSWHGAIKLAPGQIVAARVLNFSADGVQMQTSARLQEKATYAIMLEIPSQRDASRRTQVVCQATCQYSILSGDAYRVGMRYFGVPKEHEELVGSWAGRASAQAA